MSTKMTSLTVTLIVCDSCGKTLARYSEVSGYKKLEDFVDVGAGCPECDQPNTKHYCKNCAKEQIK